MTVLFVIAPVLCRITLSVAIPTALVVMVIASMFQPVATALALGCGFHVAMESCTQVMLIVGMVIFVGTCNVKNVHRSVVTQTNKVSVVVLLHHQLRHRTHAKFITHRAKVIVVADHVKIAIPQPQHHHGDATSVSDVQVMVHSGMRSLLTNVTRPVTVVFPPEILWVVVIQLGLVVSR